MTTANTECRYIIILSVKDSEQVFLVRTLDSIIRESHPNARILLLCKDSSSLQNLNDLVGQTIANESRVILGPEVPAEGSAFLEALRIQQQKYRNCDLLYIRCAVEVPPRWDERLQVAAYLDRCIGTISPLCDASPLFHLVSAPIAVDLVKTNDILCRIAEGVSQQIPTFLESCVYVKQETIEAIWTGELKETAALSDHFPIDLARATKSAGYVHALCDHLYVLKHSEDTAQKRLESVFAADVEGAHRNHPLMGLRQVVNDTLNQNITGNEAANLPAQLHVIHGWGGGLERWVRDFTDHDKCRRNFILKAVGNWGQFGQRIELYDSSKMERPIRVWELHSPIKSIDLANLQYRRILSGILTSFGIEAILVSSLIGHSLDILDLPVETALILHDYLPFCPAINIFFERVCRSCDESCLENCFSNNEFNKFFTNVSTQEWLDIRRRFFSLTSLSNLHFIVPTKSVERHWKQLAPELADFEFHVIPHGTSATNKLPRKERATISGKLRILVLGSLAIQKGGRLLKEVLPNLSDVADFFLVGCGKEGTYFSNYPGFVIVPHYKNDELGQIVADIAPDLGLLASIVPETFSYTLSELIAMGVPPLVPNRGSFEDRIVDGETGILYEPETEILKSTIIELANNREKIELIGQQLSNICVPSEEEMVLEYHRIIELPRYSSKRYPKSETPITQVLLVDPDAEFFNVYREFGIYVHCKLQASPRFKPWQKRGLSKVLALLFPKPYFK